MYHNGHFVDNSSSRKRYKTRSRSRNANKSNYNPKDSKKVNKDNHRRHNKSEKESSSHWRRRNTPHFEWELNDYIRNYKIKDHLADGTFGRCLLVKNRESGKYYAAKVIKPVEKYINSAKEETELCHLINRKDKEGWCSKIIETFEYKDHYIMIFERLGKSIYRLLRKNKIEGLPPTMVQKLSRQI